ncbi:MAG: LacI family DNA-binding transcriptional regulator [Bacillota bacterium]
MATLKDVALKSNVSIATVSRVLNNKAGLIGITEETRQKVLDAAKALNYQPDISARSLRLGRSLKAILFLYTYHEKDKYGLGENMFFPHPFFSHVLHGVQLGVQAKGYYVSYLSAAELEIETLRRLFDGEISGVISWGQLRGDIQSLIREKRIPLVGIEPYLSPDDILPAIYVDNELAVSQALNHLVRLGHRRIGFISLQNEDGVELPQFKERREAFLKLLPRFGLARFPGQEMFGISRPGVPDYNPGQPAAKYWLELGVKQQPTAAVVGSDLLAIGAIHTFRSMGLKIPKDISIVGIDDIDWSRYNEPPITTVRIPKEQMGELAVVLLDRLMNGKKVREIRHLIKTELIIRSTTNSLPPANPAGGDAGEGP